MKLPKTVTVAGVTYTVEVEKDLGETHGLSGYCDRHKKKIVVSGELLQPKRKKDLLHTLIHEIKHAHQYEFGITQAIPSALEEVDAETTATLFCSIFDIRFKSSPRLQSPKKTRKLKK